MLDKIKKMTKEDYKALLKIIISYIPGKILKLKNKDIWIVSERMEDARDNAYWFFKYVRENYPEKSVYYPISFKSKDYKKVETLGNVLEFGSLKHHIYFWACSKHISCHIGNGFPNEHICFNLLKWKFYSFKNIFLQHGITKDRATFLLKENNCLDLFCCACNREREFVIDKLGYSNDEVQALGFCRFDNLNSHSYNTQQILVMPTWRNWLYPEFHERREAAESRFLESQYYKEYQKLVNDEGLVPLLDKYNLEIVFFLHNDMQQYSHLFKISDERIRVESKETADVQRLLKESALLITDYSSVFFDFAYMKKPLIYFQFDKEEYRKKQYEEGYFSYERDGFGPVVFESENLKRSISDVVERKMQMDIIYRQRVEEFFDYTDAMNCKRTYEYVNKM